MPAFEFASAGRIIFGCGMSKKLGEYAAVYGKKALVVLGLRAELAAAMLESLSGQGVEFVILRVSGEPSIEVVENGLQKAKDAGVDLVIGIGGGSALDTGKAIAVLLTNPGMMMDYLEVIGQGKRLKKPSAPYIAIPTTAGTGAEVTKNAVLYSDRHHVKVSMRSEWMLPKLALVDPELTFTLPREMTASTGMDALTQCIEPFVSIRANPLCDAFCLQGIQLAAESIKKAFSDGKDLHAREKMSMASLLGGLALANAGLGAVHGFAGPIGGMYSAPHGVICGRLLPHVCKINIRALKEREPDSVYLERYRKIAQLLTGSGNAQSEDCVVWLQEMLRYLQLPRLVDYGVQTDQFLNIVSKAKHASSMKANPILLLDEELLEILQLEGDAG